jgi:hypothetical protein
MSEKLILKNKVQNILANFLGKFIDSDCWKQIRNPKEIVTKNIS